MSDKLSHPSSSLVVSEMKPSKAEPINIFQRSYGVLGFKKGYNFILCESFIIVSYPPKTQCLLSPFRVYIRVRPDLQSQAIEFLILFP
jgi:hypothetical protein